MLWFNFVNYVFFYCIYVFLLVFMLYIQSGSNMTGNDLYKRTHKSVPVIFEPSCSCMFCMLPYNFINYVFFCYVYIFLFVFMSYMVVCFVYVWFIFVNYVLLLFMYSYCYVYVFLLLCMFCSVYSVSLRCSVYCSCVNV